MLLLQIEKLSFSLYIYIYIYIYKVSGEIFTDGNKDSSQMCKNYRISLTFQRCKALRIGNDKLLITCSINSNIANALYIHTYIYIYIHTQRNTHRCVYIKRALEIDQ